MPGLLRAIGRTAVVAGTATSVSNRVSRRQGRRWAQQEEEQAPPQQEYAPPQQQYAPPPPPPVDPIQRLKDLADLKQQGVLTDDEFAVQKAKILSA